MPAAIPKAQPTMPHIPPLARTKPSPWEVPTLVRVDPFRPANEQPNIHTRWHPDIPACATIELDKAFKVECMDYSGEPLSNPRIPPRCSA